jgi:hypothetical protein
MPNVELTLDDLWEKCDACNGTGVHKPRMIGGGIPMGDVQCSVCQGARGVPTPTGKAIMDFLALVKSNTGWRF